MLSGKTLKLWQFYEDKHYKEDAIVIGNGPSLKDVPLEFLMSKETLGSNGIYLLDDFLPNYYACGDKGILEREREILEEWLPHTTSFVRVPYTDWYPTAIGYIRRGNGFSIAPPEGICTGGTATHSLLQIAFWMGFQRVFMVGMDHDTLYNPVDDQHHFHENYPYYSDIHNAKAESGHWRDAMLKLANHSFYVARSVFEGNGRQIINLTPGTMLSSQIIPHGNLKDYV